MGHGNYRKVADATVINALESKEAARGIFDRAKRKGVQTVFVGGAAEQEP